MNVTNKDQCTGCMACLNVCPVGAIEEREDEQGFFRPYINPDKCIKCNKCIKTCPSNNVERIDFNNPIGAYLGKNEVNIRKDSSSGGLFKALSDNIINKGGSVYGAQFDDELNVVHSRACTVNESRKFCGSKYVESKMSDIFSKVLQDLNNEKYVYFSGTACQISGLLSFLESKKCGTEKLITQDFICHGVGSPKFYMQYLHDFEKKFHSKAIGMNFRGKPKPGKFQNIIIDFENGKRYIANSTNQDIFYYHFLNNLILRPTCFSCNYSKIERVADITLADCFLVKEKDYVDDRLGISYVQVNTPKGKDLFDKIKDSIDVKEIDYKKYIQPNMKKPSHPNVNYDMFWQEYYKNGYYSATRKYGNRNIKNWMIRMAINFITLLKLDDAIKKIKKR